MGACLSSPAAAAEGGEQARAPRELKPWQDPAKINLAEKYLGATSLRAITDDDSMSL